MSAPGARLSAAYWWRWRQVGRVLADLSHWRGLPAIRLTNGRGQERWVVFRPEDQELALTSFLPALDRFANGEQQGQSTI